jgi:hypothetical protein
MKTVSIANPLKTTIENLFSSKVLYLTSSHKRRHFTRSQKMQPFRDQFLGTTGREYVKIERKEDINFEQILKRRTKTQRTTTLLCHGEES